MLRIEVVFVCTVRTIHKCISILILHATILVIRQQLRTEGGDVVEKFGLDCDFVCLTEPLVARAPGVCQWLRRTHMPSAQPSSLIFAQARMYAVIIGTLAMTICPCHLVSDWALLCQDAKMGNSLQKV